MEHIEQAVLTWLQQVVIGLNLCPFASGPMSRGQIRLVVCQAQSEEEVLQALQSELILLDESSAEDIETSLLVLANVLQAFQDYNQFLNLTDALLVEGNWTGKYQIASFHPQYQFANTKEEDSSNLSNRSPYPILHIIREQSIEKVLQQYAEPEQIPERNIRRMEALTMEEKKKLFPYLVISD